MPWTMRVVLGAKDSVVSKLPLGPVLMDITVTRRLQAMSKVVTEENTRYKC